MDLRNFRGFLRAKAPSTGAGLVFLMSDATPGAFHNISFKMWQDLSSRVYIFMGYDEVNPIVGHKKKSSRVIAA